MYVLVHTHDGTWDIPTLIHMEVFCSPLALTVKATPLFLVGSPTIIADEWLRHFGS
jgi:hypothetical protein